MTPAPLLSLHDAVVIMGGIAIGSLVGLALAAVVEKVVAWRARADATRRLALIQLMALPSLEVRDHGWLGKQVIVHDNSHFANDANVDALMRRGMRGANKRGWIRQ